MDGQQITRTPVTFREMPLTQSTRKKADGRHSGRLIKEGGSPDIFSGNIYTSAPRESAILMKIEEEESRASEIGTPEKRNGGIPSKAGYFPPLPIAPPLGPGANALDDNIGRKLNGRLEVLLNCFRLFHISPSGIRWVRCFCFPIRT